MICGAATMNDAASHLECVDTKNLVQVQIDHMITCNNLLLFYPITIC